MKLAEVALMSVLGLLLWSQWQEWQLNKNDVIELAQHRGPVISPWQCGLLKQKMLDLSAQGNGQQFQTRGEAPGEESYYLQREWRQQGCEQISAKQHSSMEP